MLEAVRAKTPVLFMDEAVFTTSQVKTKVWFGKQNSPITVPRKKLSFKAIAVAAAVDADGAVVALHIVDHSIDGAAFCVFLEKVAAHM